MVLQRIRTMNSTFQAFKRLVNLSKQEIGRVIVHQHCGERISLNNEGLAVRNLTKLVETTLKLSNENGFAAVTLHDISAEADLSVHDLHILVRSKNDLTHLIQSYGNTLNARILLDQIQDIHDPLQRLRVAVRTHLWLSEILEDWFFFCYMEARHMGIEEKQRIMETELSIEELFCNIIRAGQQQGTFRPVDPQLSAALLQAMLQDWYLKRWKYREREINVETYGNFLQDALERHLLSSPEKTATAT
jgi:AcrR family transcriptional regulator